MKLQFIHPDAELIETAEAYIQARRAYCAAYVASEAADLDASVQALDEVEVQVYSRLAAKRASTPDGLVAILRAVATFMTREGAAAPDPEALVPDKLLFAALESLGNLSDDPLSAAEIERQLDWWLAEEKRFNARRGVTDEEADAFCDAQEPVIQAARGLTGNDPATLRAKAKAVLLCNGGSLALVRGDTKYANVELTGQILCALLEAS